MSDAQSLPSDYIPFNELTICSNKLVNGRMPFSIKGQAPLLIGSGEIPRIWLNLPPTESTAAWKPLVQANTSLSQTIKVKADRKHIDVNIEKSPIVKVVIHSDRSAEIEQLDLRPLGLNIYGDKSSLFVGGSELRYNTFQNVDSMVGID